MSWQPILQTKKEWKPILSTKSSSTPVLAKENQVQRDPYFYGQTPRGYTFGKADEKDTSGRPYVGYRAPGDTSTTTDRTRVATKWNPILPAKTAREEVTNPRGVANEQSLKRSLGYQKGDNLDHKMALAVSGSNHPENLRVVPASQNKDGSTASNLSSDVQGGKKSLFHAQTDFALSKNLPPPVTGSRYGAFKAEALKAEEESRKANSFGGLLKNALLGLPQGAKKVGGVLKEFVAPTRGYSEEELGKAQPTVKQTALGIPKMAAEFGSSIGGLLGNLASERSLLSKIAQTKIGEKLADAGAKIGDFATPKSVEEAKAMRIADIATALPIGSLKKVGTGAKFFVNEFDNVGKLRFVPVENAKVVEISPKLETFVSKGKTSGWRISEGKTGTLIAEGRTQKEAIGKARQILEKNQDSIETAITKRIEEHGMSPRYADAPQTPKTAPQTTSALPSQSTVAPQSSVRTDLLSQTGKPLETPSVGGRKEGILSKPQTSPSAKSSDSVPLDKPYTSNKQKTSVLEPLKKAKTSIVEYVQNTQERVRQLVSRKDVKIDDASDPYLKETLYHGRVDTKIKVAKEETKAIINDLKANKLTKEEVSDYLKFRHAPERNAALGDRAAGVSTKEAEEGLARLQSSPNGAKLGEISERVQKLNNQTLELLKDSGVISNELFNKLRTKYKNHVPLNRIMENTEDFEGALSGKGFDVRSTGIKSAKGSEREVSDILGNVVHNYEQAVLRSEKNIVDQATLAFARNNKDVLGDLFKVRKPQAIGQTFDGKPLLEKTDDPNTLQMFENGKRVWIEISDPNLAVALKGVGREKLGGFMNMVGTFTRLYSGLATRFNPEFALPNKIRDLQETAVYMASKKGFKSASGTVAKDPESIKDVIAAMRGKDTEGARLYNEMKSLGGTTGGMGLSTKAKVELDIAKLEKLANSKTRRIGNNLVEYIDNWNTIFEDSTRLSVYKQALKDGLSKERAAFLAKEASINFNRMGKGGPVINALYMFANASIQGSVKMMRSLKNPKVLGGTILTVGGAVATVGEWNDKVDPNWRDKVTKWDRLNGLPVMLPSADGEARYITIPVSWGLKPIKVMSDYAYDSMSGKDFNVKGFLDDTTTAMLNAYNPVGGTDITSALTPTILDTPVDIGRNKAWHGGMIRPDYGQAKDIQYFDSLGDTKTGQVAISISEMLQSKAGVAISPADIKYGFDAYVGGAGRTVSKTTNLFGGLLTQKQVPLDEYPLLSRFYKERTAEEIEGNMKREAKKSSSLEDETRENFQDKKRIRPIYDKVQELDKTDPAGAQKMIDDMSPEDYETYKNIRQGERAKRTETLRTYLKSRPTEAVNYLRSQNEAEQDRLLKVMTDEEYALYQSAKEQLP